MDKSAFRKQIEDKYGLGGLEKTTLFNDMDMFQYSLPNGEFLRLFYHCYSLPRHKGLYCKIGELAGSYLSFPKRKTNKTYIVKKTHNLKETESLLNDVVDLLAPYENLSLDVVSTTHQN